MPENKQQLTLFKVRDLRRRDQFKIDDAYLNGYARVCKPIATAVYNSLCRHAEFYTQKAFPSQGLIAYQHSISVKAVRRGIKKLMEYNIIMVERERRKGKFMNYLYTLLDKSEWVAIGQKRPMVEPWDKSAIWPETVGGKRPTKDNKGIKDNKVLYKDNKEDTPQNLSKSFFNKESYFNILLDEFSKSLKVDREILEQEFNHFILYWTEPNKSGLKVRWELQPTFDVKRRLYTWMKNKQTWAREKIQNKGKEIIGL